MTIKPKPTMGSFLHTNEMLLHDGESSLKHIHCILILLSDSLINTTSFTCTK